MATKEFSGDGLASNLAGMSKNQLYEIMSQMKTLIEQNQQQARQILIQNPPLTRALFQAQIMLGMVQPPRAIPNIMPQASQQLQQPTQTVQPANVTMAQSLPSQVGLYEQKNISQAQIASRKAQQNQSSQVMPPPQPAPSQSVQLPRGDLSSQAALMSLPQQSSPASNMPSLLHHAGPQPSVHQTPLPTVSTQLQRPMQTSTSGLGHLPLQPPQAPQSRPPIGLSHQLQSQMGSSVSFQHLSMPQSHHSQPSFHSGMKPPGPLGPPFPQVQQPLPSQLPPQSLYQGGGAHLGPDFGIQGGNSMQVERGSSWTPGLPEITNASQQQLGRGSIGVSNQLSRPPPLTPEMEQALLQQVMSLTPEQINLLPPEQRNQVLQLQQMLLRQ